MLYIEKEKYRSKEAFVCSLFFTLSRTLYIFAAIILFTLRAWSMFYLMKMINAGRFTLPAACFYLCTMSCMQFMGIQLVLSILCSVVVF